MSKITFRADSDLVDAVEALDASKSEVMRDALRAYLERETDVPGAPLEEVVADTERAVLDGFGEAGASTRDVNVRVLVEPARDRGMAERGESGRERATFGDSHGPTRGSPGRERSCGKCGNSLSDDHVYCPNCGEKATNRVFCECGDEVRADWAFCPHCGRRTASAEAFDR